LNVSEESKWKMKPSNEGNTDAQNDGSDDKRDEDDSSKRQFWKTHAHLVDFFVIG